MEDKETRLLELLRCILKTNEEEIDPQTWDLQMERVAEMADNGEDIGVVLPAIQQYLTNSPDCRSEYEALLAMMKAEEDLSDA